MTNDRAWATNALDLRDSDRRSTPSTLIVLPGLAGHADEFAAQSSHFAGSRRVIVLEMVGGALSVGSRAERVLAFAQREGLDRFAVVGHGTSGAVALEIARRRPSGLSGVVVLDGIVPVPWWARTAAWALASCLRTPAADGVTRALFKAAFSPVDPDHFRAGVLRRLAATSVRVQRALIRSSLTYNSSKALRSTAVPVLVVRAHLPVRLEGLPGRVHRTTIEDVGHWPHVHAPVAVNAALEDLLAIAEFAGVGA